MAQVKFLIGDLKDLHKLDNKSEDKNRDSNKEKIDIDVSKFRDVPYKTIMFSRNTLFFRYRDISEYFSEKC